MAAVDEDEVAGAGYFTRVEFLRVAEDLQDLFGRVGAFVKELEVSGLALGDALPPRRIGVSLVGLVLGSGFGRQGEGDNLGVMGRVAAEEVGRPTRAGTEFEDAPRALCKDAEDLRFGLTRGGEIAGIADDYRLDLRCVAERSHRKHRIDLVERCHWYGTAVPERPAFPATAFPQAKTNSQDGHSDGENRHSPGDECLHRRNVAKIPEVN